MDGNDTAYFEYLKWKEVGYSGDFKALVELTAGTHTNCRQCILATDWQRYGHGVGPYDEPIGWKPQYIDQRQIEGQKVFLVRERGMYRFTVIVIHEMSLRALVEGILKGIEPKEVNKWKNNEHPDYERIGPALYAIYHVPSKNVIHSDEAVLNLLDFVELEVIFV